MRDPTPRSPFQPRSRPALGVPAVRYGGPVNDDGLRALRQEYATGPLDVADVASDPIEQVETWLADAVAAGVDEPNAMVLSTADEEGRPSGRTVLLKGIDPRGFVFFTNYRSRKAADLASNPRAALCFLWLPIHRQVRVEGRVERIASAESDAYFASRPRDARLGAHASPQSDVIPDRAWLDQRFADVRSGFEGVEDPPRPEHWGGYRLRPVVVELWQGRLNRLHDRIRYRIEGDRWVIERLAP